MRYTCTLALAATIALAGAPAMAADKKPEKLGSDYVQCDGKASYISPGETGALLTAVALTGGLALLAAPETDDESKRLKGDAGVEACTRALSKETNELRRVQLTLARAVHHIEVGRYTAAVEDARSAPQVAGAKSSDFGFQRGLAISALEVEAFAHLWAGDMEKAEEAAVRMADMAPYDLMTQSRAARLLALTPKLTDGKRKFYDRLGRLAPEMLVRSGVAHEWNGEYAAAAADYQALYDLHFAFLEAKDRPDASPDLLARVAVAHALAGEVEKSMAAAQNSRTALAVLTGGPDATASSATISQTEELLDFQAVALKLAKGEVAAARTVFGARSRWVAPPTPAVAFLTSRLADGASPAELTGALARSPDSIRAEGLAAQHKALVGQEDAVKTVYSAIRMGVKPSADTIRKVWKTSESAIVSKKEPKDTYVGEFLYLTGAPPTGEALLLHAALLARQNGKSSFVVRPPRRSLASTHVLYGEPGDVGMPAAVTLDAAAVIADLSPLMPAPVK